MTLLTAHRLIRGEIKRGDPKLSRVEEALATVLLHYSARMDGLTEEQSETAAESARQAVAIRSLRRRLEWLEQERRDEKKAGEDE